MNFVFMFAYNEFRGKVIILFNFIVHIVGSRVQSHPEILTDSFASYAHIAFSTDDESFNSMIFSTACKI